MALSPLRPGEMLDEVVIQAPAFEADGGGGRKRTGWQTVDTLRASVMPISYGETFKAGIERATQFFRIRIWYRPDITPQHRMVLGNLNLNIRSAVDPDRRRRETEIMAESGQADG